jgi:hypothetical protein
LPVGHLPDDAVMGQVNSQPHGGKAILFARGRAMSTAESKMDLGDIVYAELQGDMFKLSTENGAMTFVNLGIRS